MAGPWVIAPQLLNQDKGTFSCVCAGRHTNACTHKHTRTHTQTLFPQFHHLGLAQAESSQHNTVQKGGNEGISSQGR